MPGIPLTMDDVRNLCSEVQALTSARLPLEPHLAAAGEGHGRRLQAVCEEISDRISSGETVDAVVAEHPPGAAGMLAAAVAVGIRTGDMTTSVELLGDLASDLVEVRTRLMRALAYPLVVSLLAVGLFLFVIRMFLHQVFEVLVELGTELSPLLFRLMAMDEQYPYWPWACSVALLTLVFVWMISGRAARMAFRGPERLLLLIPGVSSLVRDLQFYTLTRMTELLIARQVSLPEALSLAGTCVGNARLRSACISEAACLRRGAASKPETGRWKPGQLPPLLHASVAHAVGSGEELTARLSGVAAHYHRRISRNLAWLQQVVPGALLVVFGGGAVFVYAMSVMWPVAELYRSLTQGGAG